MTTDNEKAMEEIRKLADAAYFKKPFNSLSGVDQKGFHECGFIQGWRACLDSPVVRQMRAALGLAYSWLEVEKCGCEPGDDQEPPFTCGLCAIKIRVEDAIAALDAATQAEREGRT